MSMGLGFIFGSAFPVRLFGAWWKNVDFVRRDIGVQKIVRILPSVQLHGSRL